MMTTLLILATLYLGLLLLKVGLTGSYSNTLPEPQQARFGVGTMTVVQAILSGDPLLSSRLEANLTALPEQDFLWLIDDEDAEAQNLTEALKKANPSARLRIESCPSCPDAINPKLWKLHRAGALIQTPMFCVLDDDTTLTAASAASLAEAANQHTVATGLPCYLPSSDIPSGLLSQFVNNNSVFTYLGTSRLLAPFTLNGMGYVMRREELATIQNFEPILHELTDDLALATLVLRRGGIIHQSKAPLQVKTGLRDFRHYMQIMHRWYVFTLLLLARQTLPAQLLIFVLHGLPPMLLISMLVTIFVSFSAVAGLLIGFVLLLRGWVLTTLHRRFFDLHLHRPLLSILSELMQPLHLLHALTYRTIRWRNRHYKVRDSDDFTAV